MERRALLTLPGAAAALATLALLLSGACSGRHAERGTSGDVPPGPEESAATPPGSQGPVTTPATGGPPAPAEAPDDIADLAGATEAVGRRVRVEGTARNAKLSAAVVTGDLVVYCLDREMWPPDRDGAAIRVEGELEYTDEFSTAGSGSEVSAGTTEGVFVIRTCE